MLDQAVERLVIWQSGTLSLYLDLSSLRLLTTTANSLLSSLEQSLEKDGSRISREPRLGRGRKTLTSRASD